MAKPKPRILVVDDEKDMISAFKAMLSSLYDIVPSSSGEEALKTIRENNIHLVLLDIRMPKMDGLDTLKKIKAISPDLGVIMVTASKEIKSAVESIKLGAYDYVTKPFELLELKATIEKALERKELLYENFRLRKILSDSESRYEMIGASEALKKVYKLIEDVALVDSTVLLSGESGTGKELVARAVHNKGSRREKPFLAVNCAAIPDNLLESELFGFEAGTFTGAFERKIGKFELAQEGTIFLDEIGCMSPGMQSKILRVLEDRKIDRIGSRSPIPVDVRIIAATNIDFASAIREGKFRQDLYWRLNVIPIKMPPLRERIEDVPMLIEHFIQKFNRELNKKVSGFTKEAMEALLSYHWPGNIRELQNIVERAVALSKNGMVALDNLVPENMMIVQRKNQKSPKRLTEALSALEREQIENAINLSEGNQSKAARILGIHRTTLLSKMRNLGLK